MAFALIFVSKSILKYQLDVYVLRPVQYVRLYGISGIVVTLFGAGNVWDMQAEVLGSRNDETALAFRKSVQDESITCAIAVTGPLAWSVNSDSPNSST